MEGTAVIMEEGMGVVGMVMTTMGVVGMEVAMVMTIRVVL